MNFIASYVYSYEELVFVTEATRSATEWQWQNKNTDNKKKNKKEQVNKEKQYTNWQLYVQVYKLTMDSFVCTGILCVIKM